MTSETNTNLKDAADIATRNYLVPSLTKAKSVVEGAPAQVELVPRMGTRSSPQKVAAEAKESKEGRPRGKNFLIIEDKALAIAWANATQDPIVGTDQSSNEFFTKLFKNFVEYWNSNSFTEIIGEGFVERGRTVNGLKTRFKNLTSELNYFIAIFNNIPIVTTGNVSEQDKINAALTVFNQKHHRDFKFIEVWDILKNLPKFLSPRVSNNDIIINVDDEDDKKRSHENSYDATSATVEIVGRDKAKKLKELDEKRKAKETRDSELIKCISATSAASMDLMSTVKSMGNTSSNNDESILKTAEALRNQGKDSLADELLDNLAKVQLKRMKEMLGDMH